MLVRSHVGRDGGMCRRVSCPSVTSYVAHMCVDFGFRCAVWCWSGHTRKQAKHEYGNNARP